MEDSNIHQFSAETKCLAHTSHPEKDPPAYFAGTGGLSGPAYVYFLHRDPGLQLHYILLSQVSAHVSPGRL